MKKVTTKRIIILLLLINFFSYTYSQNKTDSLETVFEQSSDDSIKNIALEQLYNEYLKDNWGMAINSAKNGIALFKESNPQYTIFWYSKLGDIYLEQGFYTLSLNAYTKALTIADINEKITAPILLNIAKIFYFQKKYNQSIEIYNKALSQYEKLKKTDKNTALKGIAKTYNKLGIVYELQGDLETSKKYFLKALNIRLNINEAKDIADSYTSLGYFSNVIQEFDSAFYYFTNGINICNKYNNFHYFNDLHLFRSITYAKKGLFQEAYNDIDTAKQYALTFNHSDLSRIYYYFAQVDFEKDDYLSLKTNTKISLQYADSFKLISQKNKTLKLLIKAAKKNNDFKTAYINQSLLTDNIILNETEKLVRLEQNLDLEIEKRQNFELNKTNKNLERNLNLFQLLLISGILIFILLILMYVLNTRKNKRIKKALQIAEKEKIKAKKTQKELEDSTELIRSQAALSEILRNITGKERSIEEFLQDALNKLLDLPWLNVMSKGSVFLTDENGNLKMVAEKGLGEVAERCALIKPGECLCGKALSEKKIQFCNHINHEHEIRFKNMAEHGHYNLPVMMHDEVLGVLNIYTDHNHKKTDSEINFLQIVSDTLASVINRKKIQTEILKTKNELEEKNQAVRLYLTQLEQRNQEQEILNQTVLIQKKEIEAKQKETEKNALQIEKKAKEQEALNQQLFAQKMEVEQRNAEVEQYSKQIEEKAKEQEALYQQLFAQKMEVEQRNAEVEQYSKQIEEKAKEQEALNQQLFAQKLEVEQRNTEVEQYLEQIKKYNKEQEALNQKLFAQKLEVEQRNFEAEQYSKQLEEKAKEQEALNQKLFAQKMEVEQRNTEVEQYLKQIEEQKKEQDILNQKLFAQKLEVEQRSFEIEQYSKEVETLKLKAEDTLDHLNASINYSKFIQDSLLPDLNYLKKLIPGDLFIHFQPKETIGGDFYYAKQINDYVIFAVADCTGHGIPGALITMLGISFLNNITERNLSETTGETLNMLREHFKDIFKSHGNSMENKNGLDIALCAVNLKTNVMQYSGAFNSLILFRNEELNEYKATRNPIGYYPLEKDFETTEIQLQKDDVFYLFSDGYSDQIGGERNRKFSKRQFKSLLSEIHKYPMNKQQIFTKKIIQKWQGNNYQVDDITLMGIKWDNKI